MKKNLKIWMILGLLFLSFSPVFAEDQKSNKASFTLDPIYPENQIDRNAGYFHLDVRNLNQQTVEVIIHNNANQKASFDLYFNLAKTNRNGLIVYADEISSGANDSLPYNIEEQVKLSENHLQIPAQSSRKVTMNFDYHGLDFSGILMGALTVREDTNSKAEGISHVYQYTIGVVLSQDGRNDLPGSKTFNMNDVSLGLDGGHKVLDYYIDNLENNIARNLNFSTTLTNLDTEKVIFNEKVENYSIAPNGRLPLRLDWLKKEVKAGLYRLEVELNEGQEFWTYDFVIEEEKASSLNREASYKVRIPNWVFNLCVVLGILTILNTIYLMQRQNKREE